MMSRTTSSISRRPSIIRTRAWMWILTLWFLKEASSVTGLFVGHHTEEAEREDGVDIGQGIGGEVVQALNRVVQVLEDHERHTTLYERVALLEENYSKKTENEARLEVEVQQLRAKIPELEAEIETIPEMRKDLAEFEAKIEKLVHDYEAKLSTLASEVIRLKKSGARRKDLQTLSDGSENFVLRTEALPCPEVGLGLAAERVGHQCLYFSWGTPKNWSAAHSHCQALGGDLAAPQDLFPLKTFLHRAFAQGPSIWLGASYRIDLDDYVIRGEDVDADPSILLEDAGNGTVYTLEPTPGGFASPMVQENDQEKHDDEEEEVPAEERGPTFSRNVRIRDLAGLISLDLSADEGNLGSRHRFQWLQDNSLGEPEDQQKPTAETIPSIFDMILLAHVGNSSDYITPTEMSQRETNMVNGTSQNPGISPGTLPVTSNKVLVEGGDSSNSVEDDSSDPQGPTGEEEEEVAKGRSKESSNRMKCMLLQQRESLEYELVGHPCDELHRFACEILFTDETDSKFTFDNLLYD